MDIERTKKGNRVLRIYITALALLQIAIGILVFAENSSILEDAYLGSRLIVAVLWALTFSWIALTITLHCGLYLNNSLLILPHFVFSIIFLLIQLFVLLVLVNERSRLLPILHTTSVIVVLLTTIPFEWRCYQLMYLCD